MSESQELINRLKQEVLLEQKKILLKNYEIQILELKDKVAFTEAAKARLVEELETLGV